VKTALDSRIALDKLAALEKDLKGDRDYSTKALVERHGLSRTTINGIRQLRRERPDLAQAVFADQLSLQKAMRFLRDDVRDIPKLPTRRNGDRSVPGLDWIPETKRVL
jgi:hypothetical protein